jgi:alkanesulfonate monooxygenase
MLEVYSTCPSSHQVSPQQYRRRVVEAGRWSQAAGLRGMLVYTDNTLLDPWVAAELLITHTESVVPLVAVQPVYSHPFTVARQISSIAFVHGRGVDLNLVTGGFADHLRALGDTLDHAERYDRLVEFGQVVRRLLRGGPVTHVGDFYGLNGATLYPSLPAELLPRVFVSGASPDCADAQKALRAVRLSYPRALREYAGDGSGVRGTGIRVGILARDTAEQAWREAHRRFPADRFGEELHDVAAGLVESQWHQALSRGAAGATEEEADYWMYPFRTYRTFCPYLVGSYESVARVLRGYLGLGVSTVVLDVPLEEDDPHHAVRALRLAQEVPVEACGQP